MARRLGAGIRENWGKGGGTVFELARGSNAITTLVAFNFDKAIIPCNSLISDAAGNLYGTTNQGGAYSDGTVFEVAAGTHAVTTLATFNGTNLFNPQGSLVLDSSGNLYGCAADSVFEVAAGTHALTTLVTFNGTNGSTPQGSLIFDAAGNMYGTTEYGGPGYDPANYQNSHGTVFEVAAATHALTTLAEFNGINGTSLKPA